ncbi:MAG: glycosyltransferase [Clostridiales bacterium]|nr:glycosyltransferase [Clostridiales bacterium]
MDQRNSQPLVSVIVPVYKVEKYLAHCLDSIIEQTYKNLEIIVINDGSPDRCGEICLQYAQKDPRIRVFTQENQGLSAARNVGLDNMNGEYVTLVDSDDYISPFMVEVLLAKALEYDVPIALCNYLEVADGDEYAVLDEVPPNQESLCKRVSRDEVFDTMRTKDNVKFADVIWKIYHKRIFETLRFAIGRFHEDEFAFHEIYRQVNDVCYVDLKLYAYRQSVNSITREDGVRRTHIRDVMDMRLERLAFFKEYGVEKYFLLVKRELFSEFAAYFSEENILRDDKLREEAKQYTKKIEARVYQITGKRYFSWRWTLFKIAPRAYRFTRERYLKVRELKHKKSI